MDHLSPNCIAGASSPNKVVLSYVPAQALVMSVRLSQCLGESLQSQARQSKSIMVKETLCTICTGFFSFC